VPLVNPVKLLATVVADVPVAVAPVVAATVITPDESEEFVLYWKLSFDVPLLLLLFTEPFSVAVVEPTDVAAEAVAVGKGSDGLPQNIASRAT